MNYNTIIIVSILAVIVLWPIIKKITKNIKIENLDNIHIACLYGDLNKIKKLISSGVNINSKDFSNRTPLMYAAEDGAVETIEYLLKNGADINETDVKGDSALIIAIKNNNIKASQLLIEKGADIRIKNEDNKDASNIAADMGYKEISNFIEKIFKKN
ncbi:ankyrin repeat domain-containing protein [uncultured Brachyspira sp.]|uniref:ankyrin repeat domain-containing protein n=1 Tax=uncultured Brachyspira sp. TaxID=221953 RepID=UPI0025D3BFF0|nr:ankyrin repeat domain-containing protein [uncultured Brachyspira sp.]